MEIKQIKLYNLPWNLKNRNRLIDKKFIDNASTVEIITPPNFSYVTHASTSISVVVKSTKRSNYMVIESDLYDPNFSLSYWFVESVEEVESNEAYKYSLVLDVMVTFGKDLLALFSNKTVHIKRWHEDRYLKYYDSTNKVTYAKINKEHIGLIKSDIKVGNHYGQTKEYEKMLPILGSDGDQGSYRARDGVVPVKLEHRIDYSSHSKAYWFRYAVINADAKPDLCVNPNDPNDNGTYNIMDASEVLYYKRIETVGYDRTKFLMPLGGTTEAENIVFNEAVNTIDKWTRMGKDKIDSIFLSPIPLTDPNLNFFRYKQSLVLISSNEDSNQITPEYLQVMLTKRIANKDIGRDLTIVIASFWDRSYNFNKITWNGHLKTEIDLTNGMGFDELDTYKNFLITNKFSEIALFHPDIINGEFLYRGWKDPIKIDTANYLKNPKIKISAFPDSIGLLLRLNISDYHFIEKLSETNLNVISSSGVDFITKNKTYLDAQKEGARLQAKLGRLNADIHRRSSFSGGILGAITSVINPNTWINFSEGHEVMDTYGDIANNSIAKINGQISAAMANAPDQKEGSGSSWVFSSWDEMPESLFYFRIKIPAKTILDSIINHFNKYGYLKEQLVKLPNKDDWYHTRKVFNYLQIDNILDMYDPTYHSQEAAKYDENILKLFESELNAGVRIWYQERPEYSKLNYEIAFEK